MDNELEMMREQLALLQNKLDKEVTLREESLRKLLSKGALSLRKREIVIITIGVILVVWMPYKLWNLSVPLWLFTQISLIALVGWRIYRYFKLHIGQWGTEDIITTQQEIQTYRKWNRIQQWFLEIPFFLIYISWWMIEFLILFMPALVERIGTPVPKGILVIGGCVGFGMMYLIYVIFGTIAYYTLYRPQMQLAREMQEQIADLTQE